MNCKPGDLAVIRGCVETTECNGMLVTVLQHVIGNKWVAPDGYLHRWGDDGLSTAVQSLGSAFHELTGQEASVYAVFETRVVHPIRDPGEDARDETLNWLPVPSKEIA